MVARIISVKSVLAALRYNERKVEQGDAERIGAINFLKDVEWLTPEDIRFHFLRIDALNELSVKRALHLSLNFDPSENFSSEKMVAIATRYMQQIGYGHQPFVVYRHNDAAHPHFHVVSTMIGWDGRRIPGLSDNRLLGTVQRAIEQEFSLVSAQGKRLPLGDDLAAQRVVYGKSETKSSIERVLRFVLRNYHLRSLEQLNGVLRLYNLSAEPAPEGSPSFAKGGVLYRVLDTKGVRIGKPVPSSDLRVRADRMLLEQKFQAAGVGRELFLSRLKSETDWALSRPGDLKGFIQALERKGIHIVPGSGEIVLVDHNSRHVFSGSELGAQYSLERLRQRFFGAGYHDAFSFSPAQKPFEWEKAAPSMENSLPGMLATLLAPGRTEEQLPYGLRQQRKKKKRLNKHL